MAHPAEFQTRASTTDLPVGEILRRTRIHYNKSIKDVQDVLRISSYQIEAIEQGDNEKLPARVYALGFVRSYSEFLGLDGDKMVALYKTQSTGKVAEPVLNFPVTANDSKAPPIWLALICLVVFLGGVTIYFSGQNVQRAAVVTVPEVPAPLKAETLEREQVPPTPQAAETAAPAAAPVEEPQQAAPAEPVRKGITLNIKENSWVEIRGADNKKILSRVLKAGEKYFIPERANLTMSIGNAGGVEIEINGEPLETADSTLGPKGQVMRGIPLNGETLKQRFVSEKAVESVNPVETLVQ